MNYVIRKIAVLFIVCSVSSSTAWFGTANNKCQQQYECSCQPLACGSFDLQIHGGTCPIIWQKRNNLINGTSSLPSPTSPILALFNSPHFGKLFHEPWIVGAQIGYAWTNNMRMYGEFNYAQAKGKSDVAISTITTPALAAAVTQEKYKLYDTYIGGRYYWDRWYNRIAFFLGAKVGLNHHQSINVDLAVGIPTLPPVTLLLTNVPAFKSNTYVSGGINAGCDICFCTNWAFVITGEWVVSSAPKISPNILLNPSVGQFTAISFGSIGAEFRFPITAGLRYTF